VSSGNRTDYAAIFAATPSGQSLYFVDSTYTTAFPAAGGQILDTSVNIYLVVAYDVVTFITVFGRQGYGTINISTSEFVVDSEVIKLTTIPTAVKSDFVYYDTATKALSHNPLSVLGSANGATYTFGGNTDVPVVSIDFDNFIISAPANGVVTLQQGYLYGGELTDSLTVSNYTHYVLGTITSSNKTITLPIGIVGNSIKFTNMSQLDANGIPIAYESESAIVWVINPNGSEKIMRASELVLDASTQSFEIFYSGATNGWILN